VDFPEELDPVDPAALVPVAVDAPVPVPVAVAVAVAAELVVLEHKLTNHCWIFNRPDGSLGQALLQTPRVDS